MELQRCDAEPEFEGIQQPEGRCTRARLQRPFMHPHAALVICKSRRTLQEA